MLQQAGPVLASFRVDVQFKGEPVKLVPGGVYGATRRRMGGRYSDDEVDEEA